MIDLEKRAIDLFGITSDFGEAGYLLKNGTLLDFSEKNDGGTSGVRTLDQREVSELYDNEYLSTDSMKRFVRESGAVRVSFNRYLNTALIDITTESEITKTQKASLCRLAIMADIVYIDYYNNYESEAPVKQYSLNMPRVKAIKEVLEEIERGGKQWKK